MTRLLLILPLVLFLSACTAPAPTEQAAAPSPAEETAAEASPSPTPEPTAEPTEEPTEEPTNTPEPTPVPPTAPPEPPTSYGIGETANLGDLAVTVHSVQQIEGSEFIQPEAGNRFIVLDVTIENRGIEEAQISTVLQMELRDPEGRRYQPDFMATADAGTASLDTVLVAGDRVRGPVGYQIPINSGPLQWIFQEPFSGNRVVFNLGEV